MKTKKTILELFAGTLFVILFAFINTSLAYAGGGQQAPSQPPQQ